MRTGNIIISETWRKSDLLKLYQEAQYFAVNSLVNILSLRFFDSKILINDAVKQRVITRIRDAAKLYSHPRDISPTNEWVLRFDYDQGTETKREAKKWRLTDDICFGRLCLVLYEVRGRVYGKFDSNFMMSNKWMHMPSESFIFRCPGHPHLDNPDDAADEVRFLEVTPRRMTDTERKHHKDDLIDFWVLAQYPLAIGATDEGNNYCDFTMTRLNENKPSVDAIQKIEVWHIPSRCAMPDWIKNSN